MRRLMLLISLVAALSSTPLRLVEAAHDIASSNAELGGGPLIETIDGGVGDDSDATIKASGPRLSATPAAFDVQPPRRFPVHPPRRALPAPLATLSPPSLPRRLALLQRFLR